jgi:hypothetical protein
MPESRSPTHHPNVIAGSHLPCVDNEYAIGILDEILAAIAGRRRETDKTYDSSEQFWLLFYLQIEACRRRPLDGAVSRGSWFEDTGERMNLGN